jgi:hypothetical protein
MQHMVILLGAHFECNELVCRRAWCGFTSCDEVGAWASDGVLDDVGYEQGQDHADEPAEDCDVGFMCARAEEEGPEHEGAEREGAGVDEEPCWGGIRFAHSLV